MHLIVTISIELMPARFGSRLTAILIWQTFLSRYNFDFFARIN